MSQKEDVWIIQNSVTESDVRGKNKNIEIFGNLAMTEEYLDNIVAAIKKRSKEMYERLKRKEL